MKLENLVRSVGEDWAQFLKPFMVGTNEDGTGCPYDSISAQVNDAYKVGASDPNAAVYPTPPNVFRAFRETPFEKVRVVILGQDPYARAGYATGVSFESGIEDPLPPALTQMYNAIEKDIYNGLDVRKNLRKGQLGRPDDSGTVNRTWMSQGVLMLNAALTVKKDNPNSHKDIWAPFIKWFLNNLWRLKRGVIYTAWGDESKTLVKYKPTNDAGPDGYGTATEGVNMFFGFVLTDEHPVYASRQNRDWLCTHFSKINLIIKANHLGEPIEW